jgi:hypothetical protein
VLPDAAGFYARWREAHWPAALLRERPEAPPESLLQAVWFHQRLHRDRLRTLDGRAVRVLHPGFWNREAGPDFRQAVLQLGADAPVQSDVEIDLSPSGWRAHGHHTNPAYRNVVLHVVWDGTAPVDLPTLALQPVLDSPLAELAAWLGDESGKTFPAELRGQCSAPLSGLAAAKLRDLLEQAALVRLRAKAAALQARAREAGWEQALWEGLFRALGYKHNVWPMLRLGELRPRLAAAAPGSVRHWQARLLGVAGLLPADPKGAGAGARDYHRTLWDVWWRERGEFQDCLLPVAAWRFAGLRPANHPQRRLALAAHWLAADKLPALLEEWCAAATADDALAATLGQALQAGPDEFWERHWTMRSPRLAKRQPLLGAARVTDLAVNVILPWLWVRAAEGGNPSLAATLERRFLAWPAGEDNAVLRLLRQRLLGGRPARGLRSAACQQGLLQIARDFCEHSDALCAECRFPGLVRQWTADATPG